MPLSPADYGRALLRFWWIPLLASVAGLALVLALESRTPTEYTSGSSVLISVTRTQSSTNSEAYAASLLANQRVQSYANLARGTTLSGRVAEEVGLESAQDVIERASISVPDQTTQIAVVATDTDPETAQAISASVSEQLVGAITRVERRRGGGEPQLRAEISDQATLPTAPLARPTTRNRFIGVAGGALLGLALAMAAYRLDRRVLDASAAGEGLGAPVIGTLVRGRRAVAGTGEPNTAAGALEVIRTKLFFLDREPGRALTLAITSPAPLESTATLARDLAVGLSETGARVLLLECDASRPHLRAKQEHGQVSPRTLAELLAARRTGEDDRLPVPTGPLVVVAAGTAADPSPVPLHSPEFAGLLQDVSRDYDFVLMTSPPLSDGSAALAVAAQSSGVVVAVRRKRTKRHQLSAARELLAGVHARVIGVVLVP